MKLAWMSLVILDGTDYNTFSPLKCVSFFMIRNVGILSLGKKKKC